MTPIKWKTLRVIHGKSASNYCYVAIIAKCFSLLPLLGIIEFWAKDLNLLINADTKISIWLKL